MKYLLIDGNNLAVRAAFANEELCTDTGIYSGVHFGFFQSLITLFKLYPNSEVLIAWDGKSKRRVAEAKTAVESLIVPEGYKENRKKSEQPAPLLKFYEQAPYLQRGIGQTGISQIRMPEYEADDVVASYVNKLKKENEVIMVTSDKDYYQLLDENVTMWNGMKQELITKSDFVVKNGISPEQHVDCGALMGDDGDNIFGVPGWGETNAPKAIKEKGTWENLLLFLHEIFRPYRDQYPDLTGENIKKITEIKTKSGKQKYSEVNNILNAYSGVALAIEEKKLKPTKEMKEIGGIKNNLMALMFEKRIKVAYSLKKMDSNIQNLPTIKKGVFNEKRIKEYLAYYQMKSLVDDIQVLK